MTTPEDFNAYAVGICCASVCTSLSVEEATEKLNSEYPTGIQSKWQFANEPFSTGAPNPSPCHDYPETHKHYLFMC